MKEELENIIEEELENINPSIIEEYEPIEDEINKQVENQNKQAEFEKKKVLLNELLKLKSDNFTENKLDDETLKEQLELISLETLQKEVLKARKEKDINE